MNNDYQVRNYQDDLDVDPNKVDPIMSEQDDPVETFGIPASEFKDELDKLDLESPDATDDMRAELEDLDEDGTEVGGRQ
jgi:hypothetical protein